MFLSLCGIFACTMQLSVVAKSSSDCCCYLTAEQIESMDHSFSEEKRPMICLGVDNGKADSTCCCSLAEAGMHIENKIPAEHHFDTFEEIAFESSGEKSSDYWMVIDEKNLQSHSNEISERAPKKH